MISQIQRNYPAPNGTANVSTTTHTWRICVMFTGTVSQGNTNLKIACSVIFFSVSFLCSPRINFSKCVVPENIHTPTTEGVGVGGSKAQEIPEGREG